MSKKSRRFLLLRSFERLLHTEISSSVIVCRRFWFGKWLCMACNSPVDTRCHIYRPPPAPLPLQAITIWEKNQRSVDLGYVDLRGLRHLLVVPTLLRSFCTTQSASFSFSVASLNSQSAAGDFCSVKDGKSVASCNETC